MSADVIKSGLGRRDVLKGLGGGMATLSAAAVPDFAVAQSKGYGWLATVVRERRVLLSARMNLGNITGLGLR